MSLPPSLVARFRDCFGSTPRGFRAPGRVNLIGEHTDYNGGFVLPAAISFHTHVLAAPRTDRKLRIHSTAHGETVERGLDVRGARARHWSDYAWGTARALADAGIEIAGADLLLHGDVPLGAGLSSSASLEVATARALLALAGAELEPTALAEACQRAENVYVGMRCGIMDQFASTLGAAGHALLLDCRSLEHELVPLGGGAVEGVRLVITNSRVHHAHAGGEYNLRREECERGVAALATRAGGIHSLRDVSPALLADCAADLDPVVHRRCRHVLSENARVQAFARALRAGDLAACGEAMAASHRSMRDDYEITCPEIDLLVELATGLDGVHGSRMTGGGFGGCTISLVASQAVESFRATLGERYAAATGIAPEVYVCEAVDGAARLPEEVP